MKKVISRTRAQVYKIWLKALRSGKYKRIEGQLRKTNFDGEVVGFCCLGVLQDLAVKDGGDKWYRDTEDGPLTQPRNTIDEEDAQPQQQILDFMGLDQDTVEKLINMNDVRGFSFTGIANYIEKKILPKVL